MFHRSATAVALFVALILSVGIIADSGVVPTDIVDQPVNEATAGALLYFERDHRLSVGDKGEEHFDLSVDKPDCGEEALVFHDAQLVYKARRFGEAKIIERPQPGCFDCSPLTVRWYHEPTGFVSYQVHVYRKRVVDECPVDE